MSLRRALPCLLTALTIAASSARAAHKFDLAANLPPRLAIMFSMSWFGIGPGDPGGAVDAGYGNWKQNFNCNLVPYNDPIMCTDLPGAGLQRSIASKRRPLAGIYSSAARDDESKHRIDLMLSTLRRPCDDGARLDAFAIQLSSIKFTSRYPNNQQSVTWDLAYRSLNGFLDRADAAGLVNAVAVSSDATDYWHFGDNFGLTTQQQRLFALTDDIVDMAKLAAARKAALKVNGRPLLIFYVDAPLVSPAEWKIVLDDARAASGVDFYALGATLNSTFFDAFDALVPWVNLGIWANATGANVHDRAVAWQMEQHAQLVRDVGSYPGRVIFGAVTPGFDDFTYEWGKCNPREIPRDPALLDGQFDYFLAARQQGTLDIKGLFFQTWDDWTEGTEFEPDVVGGSEKLVQARQLLGKLFGDAVDPAGDAALAARWSGYGQARNCCFMGGACPDGGAPDVNLICPMPGSDGGVVGKPDGGAAGPDLAVRNGGDGGGDAGTTPSAITGGCGCAVGERAPIAAAPVLWSALTAIALGWRRARRNGATRGR